MSNTAMPSLKPADCTERLLSPLLWLAVGPVVEFTSMHPVLPYTAMYSDIFNQRPIEVNLICTFKATLQLTIYHKELTVTEMHFAVLTPAYRKSI